MEKMNKEKMQKELLSAEQMDKELNITLQNIKRQLEKELEEAKRKRDIKKFINSQLKSILNFNT